ncbi:MAG: glutathione S-transferase family protein [Pelomonas sp.]|nr:glutathione S-transferase family protein [Roseateles sp.]
MKLYGTKGSGSAAVEAALVLLGQPFEAVEAASWQPSPGSEELARINLLGQIPTLVLDDGSVLSESAAILIHLGLAHPDSGLLPADPAARAQAIRGLVYIAANCYALISVIDFPDRYCIDVDEATTQRMRDGTRATLHRHWKIFADEFAATEQPFLGGAVPGALDLLAGVVSRWSATRKALAQRRPAFHALLQRVDAHPQLAPVFARHWPAA